MNIGPLVFDRPIALAPMEDVTDISFRLMARRLGADLVYTEFTSSEALIRDAEKALHKIEVTDEERPVGIQIYGGIEESMEKAARIATGFYPDLIDINCGCWSKRHALRGEGAGLLRDISHFDRVVRSTIKGTHLPVTVKTRLGWDEKTIVILEVARMVEQAGAKALTVHFRTRCQGYKGKADWTWIEKIKKVISIPVIGNGDIQTAEDVKRMLDLGCDGVMIGRGAIRNPWIFRESRHFLQTGEIMSAPSLEERIETAIMHLKLSIQRKGMRFGVIEFRKHYAGYLHGLPHVSRLRTDLMKLEEFQQVVDRLYEFLENSSHCEELAVC